MPELDCKELANALEGACLIDLRNPKQYRTGRLGDAISIPFAGKITAQEWWQKATELAAEKPIIVYCRNGSRSARLVDQLPFEIQFLTDGYEAWETTINQEYEEAENFVVLCGYTGSGKTEILQALAQQGAQVIDLEGLAQHKGSVFGNLEAAQQPTHDAFQLALYRTFLACDKKRPIYVEEEGPFIGKVGLPKALHNNLKTAAAIDLEESFEVRKQRIVKQYGVYNRTNFRNAILGLEKRMDSKKYRNALKFLDTGDFETCVSELLYYYDEGYERRRKNAPVREQIIPLQTAANVQETARRILQLETFGQKETRSANPGAQ